MPHFIAECTDNIREQADLPGLFGKVNAALAATGIFPIGGIRSRAIWLDTWQMADGQHDYAFVYDAENWRRTQPGEPPGRGRYAVHADQSPFRRADESRYLALSFEIDELHPTLNYKQNNVHALFK